MKKVLYKVIEFVKKHKKAFIIAIIVLVLGLIIAFFVNNNSVSIEVASTDVNYIYGPSAETILKVKTGQEVKLKILTTGSKKGITKCYSSNKDLVKFNSSNTFTALNTGETEVYCKLVNKESNRIKVVIGG